jgi:hypothetical protein
MNKRDLFETWLWIISYIYAIYVGVFRDVFVGIFLLVTLNTVVLLAIALSLRESRNALIENLQKKHILKVDLSKVMYALAIKQKKLGMIVEMIKK